MANITAIASDYAAARARFCETAIAAGASLASYPISERGPRGEELAIDVATIGPAQPSAAVVVSSGIHGVEGFAGSAIQTSWLADFPYSPAGATRDTALVMIHALNPYGFAWRRRVNESNVDLNRNFLLSGDSYAGISPEAQRLNAFVNPNTPPGRFEPFLPKALFYIARYGMKTLKASLTQGQYENEAGLFFGGKMAEATTRLVMAHYVAWTGNAPRVLHLDFHTGLGKPGVCTLLSQHPANSPRGRWLAARFAPYHVEPVGDGIAARESMRGSMAHWLTVTFEQQGKTLAFLNPEFGTYPGITVFKALREENSLHRHPQARGYEQAKRRLLEVFCPRNAQWRESVVSQGMALVQKSLQLCQEEVWE